MKSFIKKYKVAGGVLGAFVVGIGATVGVLAVSPSAEGVINGCYSDTTGQLSVIDPTASCGTGQSSMKWDRGVLAYGHLELIDDGTTYLEAFTGQSSNVASVMNPLDYPNTTNMVCIDLASSVDTLTRFALADQLNGSPVTISLAGKSTAEDNLIAQFCPSGADVHLGGIGDDVYFSVY